ncbi:copper homeostasis protein CutC [Moheibacter sediminis]|nr:copper homeostasis protein CutC [Moheibacter sediminis]
MKLEIVSTSVQSAIHAEKGRADRIELCSELTVGGITPSYGLIRQVLEKISIPVFVLIRPRSGNFVYSDDEFEILKKDIQICKDLGCAGIVSGVLNEDNSVDFIRTKKLIELSRPLSFTFHRAFDLTPHPFDDLDKLIEIGAERILTSGQNDSAEKGLKILVKLKEKAQNRITILPGGGINAGNVHLFKENGFTEIHASASSVYHQDEPFKIKLNSEKFFDETKLFESDLEKIKVLTQIIN